MTSVLWFRRDLRISDHPALAAAAAEGEVVGLFVVDPRLWASSARRAWVAANVRALAEATGGALVLRYGDPATVVPEVARSAGASTVHVTGETTPYGRSRDARVAERVRLLETGTPYVVEPGLVRTRQGGPYQVFTPFARAWRSEATQAPFPAPEVTWRRMRNDARATAALDEAIRHAPAGMPEPGEAAALARWRAFRPSLSSYAETRDLPADDATSRLSPYLKVGAIHPRTLLASTTEGAEKFVTELAWREFYADVLWHHPESAWSDLRPLHLPYDDPGDAVDAWREGRTGFPLVDAGMRQLAAEGWMHNRVRMIAASFLTKDLHAWWPVGARHFLELLVDGDLASNNHGWQWVAGTGTDAAPYFRIFNPVTQGKRFDPDGDYVRRWVPELAHLPGRAAHEPWKHERGYDGGYPRPVVDHDEERGIALDRFSRRRSPGPAPPGRR
ncbi:MAG: deoxyribodipyrimidine photo-lyase [Nocardioidaceae bacterium]|nr:deoxyribodipyrimidine photo-lyase [Nocardioidaceae bacterium]